AVSGVADDAERAGTVLGPIRGPRGCGQQSDRDGAAQHQSDSLTQLCYTAFMTLDLKGDLKGRSALVTGAGRGIGRAVALQLAHAGASVMLNDLDRDVVFETGSLIDQAGGAAKAMPGDLTSRDFPEKLVNATTAGFGSLDIIVNNAGYTWDSVIQKTTD